MADKGTQSPLGINVLGSTVQNIGFCINPTAESYMGKCKATDPTPNSPEDYQPGSIVNDTCLKWLTYAIHDAYQRGAASQTNPLAPVGTYTLNATTYNNLITIGKSVIPALGNTPPDTWKTDDPSGLWVNDHAGNPTYSTTKAGAPANSGYPFYNFDTSPANSFVNEGQCASWYPYLAINSGQVVLNRAITQWGWIRCIALQAWNEFNYNGATITGTPDYRQFGDSFNTCFHFMNANNPTILAIENSKTFLKGAYSNQNDLMSADIAGVSLASRDFGQDLINLGNAIDFSYIKTFGLPSTTLQILQKHNALTQAVVLALLTTGLSQTEIESIADGSVTASTHQEQNIYSAMLIITGVDLAEIMLTLNCMTRAIDSLADFVNVKKMFPISYNSLTVPIYNANPGPTNSKTYYLLFTEGETNSQLSTPAIQDAVGSLSTGTLPAPPSNAETDVSIINVSTTDQVVPMITTPQVMTVEDLIKNKNATLTSVPAQPTPPNAAFVDPEVSNRGSN
jgi:hypothetical protein